MMCGPTAILQWRQIVAVVDGKREPPRSFASHINMGKWTAHPFIARDESYLLWDSECSDGFGNADLYVSFRLEEGS